MQKYYNNNKKESNLFLEIYFAVFSTSVSFFPQKRAMLIIQYNNV